MRNVSFRLLTHYLWVLREHNIVSCQKIHKRKRRCFVSSWFGESTKEDIKSRRVEEVSNSSSRNV